ncbi:CoA transferase [Streptomyces silvensis]|uniref:Acyl-CoA transferase n=1 Tax=Streptomyces silvensis TaxID=1765722 RepID=A0A0W7X1A7_9ACTN|nr:CoA transferase [Streptomyces silvensis]KUF16612.1 acyl-CoA transferase [Streptomyces silvensis]
MTSPALTTAQAAARPLDALRCDVDGPPELTWLAAEHLRLLGAVPRAGAESTGGTGRGRGQGADGPAGGRIALGGAGFGPVTANVRWADPAPSGTYAGVHDEATAQAATGVMAVHGRRDGDPRGLAADYTATAAGVLAVQGLLAQLFARARGAAPDTAHGRAVDVSAARAGLLSVSQYFAATGADETEATELAPGGPPFTSADGTLFELETLDPGAWAAFWRALGAPAEAIRAGWRPFQFRYATACAPFPDALHTTARGHRWTRLLEAAAASGAEVCALRTLAERAAEHDGAAPWTLSRLGPAAVPAGRPGSHPATPGRPLAGVTVLEAGRRIQAPLAAHLLRLLGADVVRIEPPGGDPLRGMPPACGGVSARWLALNRGKRAVEADIKSPSGRRRLRELVAEADVFLHNWAPGKAAQLGLDAADLSAVNPGIVYAYTSGWAGRLDPAPMGTDFMVQARAGVGAAVRPADEPPAPSLMTLLDVLGGLLGAEAVLAGLLLRERNGGRGVRVDSSLLAAADALTAPALRRAARGAEPRRPAGFRRPLRTADGWVAPADRCAAAAAAYDLTGLPTPQALRLLGTHGLAATAVTTDLASLHGDARFAGTLDRDTHGAPKVPTPWTFT